MVVATVIGKADLQHDRIVIEKWKQKRMRRSCDRQGKPHARFDKLRNIANNGSVGCAKDKRPFLREFEDDPRRHTYEEA
jgi:hypothetical protein